MRLTAAIFVLAAPAILASPLQARGAPPTVTIKDGTVVGSTAGGVDSFYGIPFAQPPVGPLRLKSPLPLQTPFGTFQATNPSPTACPQGITGPMGEDCLNINVFRPSSASQASKLPVLVFIYGGGFIGGQNTNINASDFVINSIKLGYPYIFAAMNYRIGGFGFLAGTELQQDGSTNLGLKDQRLALQWVQANIGAFGGDPTKVTLWGGSAGSISVMDQTIINEGNNTYNGAPLFRAAIQGSGSILPAMPVDSTRAQTLYGAVVSLAGCSGATPALPCLRNVPFLNLLQATFQAINATGYQSFDFPYIPRPDPSSIFFPYSPEVSIVNGLYARVPVISGDVEDEGTAFTGGLYPNTVNISSTNQLIAALANHFANTTTQDAAQLVAAYPSDLASGSPYRTGNANNIYPEYKLFSSIFGDVTFTLMRRAYLSVISQQVKTYSYLDCFLYGYPTVGTFHSSDFSVDQLPNPQPIIPRDSVLTYYTSFVNFADPNKIPSIYPVWPLWTTNTLQMLNFSISNVTPLVDNFRTPQYQNLVNMIIKLRL